MSKLKRVVIAFVVIVPLLSLSVWLLLQLDVVRRFAVAQLSAPYVAEPISAQGNVVFDGLDARRKQHRVELVKVAEGFTTPTDVQFVPGRDDLIVVAQKAGRCEWTNLTTKQKGLLFEVDVVTESELGLLGVAFHPRFADNGKLYVNYNVKERDKLLTRISEWQVARNAAGDLTSATELRVMLNVEQPYQNHNGGQLVFGPDGFLYIGLGDGGFRDDPHGNGQDHASLLGKMLRIDVDNTSQAGKRAGSTTQAKPYAIPQSNPFLNDRSSAEHNFAPEIWAYGLRNPWRFSFDPRGRLIVADVGQDKWEEISIVEPADNLGWNVREGRSCFDKPDCRHDGMKDPVYVYGRDDGQSITGGVVYTADDSAALHGKYLFADFVRGRFWAITLPDDPRATIADADVIALGRFAVLPSAFARDSVGRVYVADFGGGAILRVVDASPGRRADDASPK